MDPGNRRSRHSVAPAVHCGLLLMSAGTSPKSLATGDAALWKNGGRRQLSRNSHW